MAKRDFSKIAELLNTNKDFSLTENQYHDLVGYELPKRSYYLENKSAVAKLAKKNGYKIYEEVGRVITFVKEIK